jgi:membrane associated rhomboid family serine protease
MGIYDRDYVRRQPTTARPASGGLGRLRLWSVNTCLIVACIAVFFVGGVILPPTWVFMGTSLMEGVPSIEGMDLVEGDIQPDPKGGLPFAPLHVETPDGPVVAGNRYQQMRMIESALHFSTYRGILKVEFWRLVGFQFLHSHGMVAHIVFNMVGLFFFGSIVEQYLGRKRYLAFYLLCGICGALLYGLLNILGLLATMIFGPGAGIPGLLFNDLATPLIGASAGVYGVIMAGAFLVPNATAFLLIFPMRVKTLAYAIVGIAFFVLLTGGSNAGGEAGHIGGAIAGWYFIRHPRHLHGFFDILGRVDPTSHHYRGKGRTARAGAVRKSPLMAGRRDAGQAAEIDRILDKIRAGGIQSLTDHEKQVLRKASEE